MEQTFFNSSILSDDMFSLNIREHLKIAGFFIISALYLLFIIFVFASFFRQEKFFEKTDIVSFLTGAKIIYEGKANHLYDINTQLNYQNEIVYPVNKTLLPFRNFPILAIIYIPFLNLSLKEVYIMIFLINVGLLIFFHYYFTRQNRVKHYPFFLFLLPVLFYPSVSNLVVGQFMPFVLLIFTMMYFLLKNQRAFSLGILNALLLIKPQYMLFTPFVLFLTKEKSRYLLGLLSGILAFLFLNFLVIGSVKPFWEFPAFILATENSLFGSRPEQMPTIYGLVNQLWLGGGNLNYLVINFLLYIGFLYLVILVKVKNYDLERVYISGVIITILFSLHALIHDLVLLILPLYIFIFIGGKRYLRLAILTFLLAACLQLFPITVLITFSLIVLLIFVNKIEMVGV